MKMRVCILTTSFPRYKGDPSGNFVYELAKNLVKKGVEVNVVAPHDYETKSYEVMDGIEIHRFQYMFPKRLQRLAYHGGIPSNIRRSFIAKLELPLFMLSFFTMGFRICRKCDVIHAQWAFSGLVGTLLKKIYRKHVVLTVHGSDINNIPQKGLLKKLSVYTFKNVDQIIAVSNALKNRISDFGISTNKIKVIPNAVNIIDFPVGFKDTNDFKILFVGRLVPEKGLKYLIEAMKEVIKEIPRATLTIVGDGPLRKELEKLVEELSIQDKIRFEGMKTHSEIPKYMQGADLFVLPSLSEGLPLVLLEAMAVGKPVVTTKVGGILDVVIDGETGVIVPPRDSKALIIAITYLLENDEKRMKMSENARRCIEEKFTWKRISEKTFQLYKPLIANIRVYHERFL